MLHDAETTFSCSRHLPGLVASGGKDGAVAMWDIRHGEPAQISSRTLGTGSVFSIKFHPNSPHIVGACGAEGKPLVYTIRQDLAGSGFECP
jgi:periodic tryptophan protein 1